MADKKQEYEASQLLPYPTLHRAHHGAGCAGEIP